jgi:hypothetical protein
MTARRPARTFSYTFLLLERRCGKQKPSTYTTVEGLFYKLFPKKFLRCGCSSRRKGTETQKEPDNIERIWLSLDAARLCGSSPHRGRSQFRRNCSRVWGVPQQDFGQGRVCAPGQNCAGGYRRALLAKVVSRSSGLPTVPIAKAKVLIT